jgi:O-antigen/teichoic acid export membrane protein
VGKGRVLTRTDKATRHLLTNALSFFVLGIGQFFIRSLMIRNLGSEITGLQAVFGQIMAYLCLLEGGVGVALVAYMYAPLAEQDFEKVRSLLAGARRWYRGVALIVLALAVVVSFLLKPLIATAMESGYVRLCFLLFALASAVDYFTITPKYLLEADQRGYVGNIISLAVQILDLGCTIAMLVLRLDFAFILVKTIVVNASINLAMGAAARRRYSWLAEKANSRSYGFTREIKFLIAQNLASVVVYNTAYIFLSHYLDLNEVTRYSNYVIIINFLSNLAAIFSKAASSGLGELLARKDLGAASRIQEELGAFLAFFASTTALTFLSVSPSFIDLWVGKGFRLGDDKLLAIAGLYYYAVARTYVITALNSAGKFREVTLSPIIESAVNLALSFALVPRIGLMGLLIGNAAGHLASSFIFYPLVCYKRIYGRSPLSFYAKFFARLAPVLACAALIIAFGSSPWARPEAVSIFAWVLGAALRFAVLVLGFGALYWAFSKDFRSLADRGALYLRGKLARA